MPRVPATWSVPKLWSGKTIAILASGPSMNQQVADSVRAAEIPTIVINSTFRLAPWADMLYAADHQWWATTEGAKEFKGLKVTCTQPQFEGVLSLEYTGSEGFDPEPHRLRTGKNSGYQAIHIALHAGASRILLCGYNMGGSNWHGVHPEPLRTTTPDAYKDWRDLYFPTLLPAIKSLGVQVINCTPDSNLTCFEFRPLDEVLREEERKAQNAKSTEPTSTIVGVPS